eukprot:s3873_g5.t1
MQPRRERPLCQPSCQQQPARYGHDFFMKSNGMQNNSSAWWPEDFCRCQQKLQCNVDRLGKDVSLNRCHGSVQKPPAAARPGSWVGGWLEGEDLDKKRRLSRDLRVHATLAIRNNVCTRSAGNFRWLGCAITFICKRSGRR